MDLKDLDPKVKRIILAVCILGLLLMFFVLGGYSACKQGGGDFMQDWSCVDTERLDLCRSPDGMVWQYNDKNPPLILNLSENNGE